MNDQNQRLWTRLTQTGSIFIEMLSEDISGTDPGKILLCGAVDISQYGLQVSVDEELVIGSILRLAVDLGGSVVQLVGEVKWVRRDTAGKGAYRVGFKIFESDVTDVEQWKNLIARLAQSA